MATHIKIYDVNVQRLFLYRMGNIGSKHIEILAQYRPLFEEYKEQPQLKEVCDNNINIIEGRRYVLSISIISLPCLFEK